MKWIIIISILVMSVFLAGCAEKITEYPGAPEEPGAGEAAAEEPEAKPVPKVTYETSEEFVDAFIGYWGEGKFEKLYPMFSSSLTSKLSMEKFAYLFGEDFATIKSIERTYYDERDSTAKFSVLVKFTDKSSERVSLMEIAEKNGNWQMNDLEQYFDPLDYCETTLDKDTCVYDYANEFNEDDLCKYAGVKFKKCHDSLGVDLTISQLKEICTRYADTIASEAECYKVLAYYDNNDYYCSVIQVAKKKFQCYGNVASLHKNLAECTLMSDEQSRSERTKAFSYCVAGFVEKTGDTSMCDEIIVSDTYSEEGKKLCLSFG